MDCRESSRNRLLKYSERNCDILEILSTCGDRDINGFEFDIIYDGSLIEE